MEAKDTVMTDEQLNKVALSLPYFLSNLRKAAQVQAEISFKAGERSGWEKGYDAATLVFAKAEAGGHLDKIKADVKQEGRGEVVEWLVENKGEEVCIDSEGMRRTSLLIDREAWKAKIKEWGLEVK